MTNKNKILGIFIGGDKPVKHYRVHFDDRVESRTLNGLKIGESAVEIYP
jgi:hypothetical protein